MSQELKPCPFCGSAPKLHYDSGNEVWGQRWWVRCKECDVASPSYFGISTWETPGKSGKEKNDKAKADAATWWNRRGQEPI